MHHKEVNQKRHSKKYILYIIYLVGIMCEYKWNMLLIIKSKSHLMFVY